MNVIDVIEIIKDKFSQTDSPTEIPLLKGDTFTATLEDDGIEVDNLGSLPFLPWVVFQEAVCVLLRNGGTALKGDAMGSKLGESGLSLDSIEGHIAYVVYGKKPGDAVFRRITPISCILIWADICVSKPKGLALSNITVSHKKTPFQTIQLSEYIEYIILPLIKASRKFDFQQSHAAKSVRYLYTQALYGFDEYATRKASVEAKRLYSSRGFTDNLAQQSVNNQHKFDPKGRAKGEFHFEHVFTGKSFKKAVKNLSEEELTVDNIETIVNENCICAWILKTENAKLDDAGYRSERPENPLDAYTEVGIILED